MDLVVFFACFRNVERLEKCSALKFTFENKTKTEIEEGGIHKHFFGVCVFYKSFVSQIRPVSYGLPNLLWSANLVLPFGYKAVVLY